MRRTSNGFTLIEMLVAMSLIAVVIALAGPSMRELILNNRQVADYNTMLSSLTLARAEAIKRRARTRVCISNATPDCDTTATRWEDGWIIVADTNGNGTVTTADGDLLLQVQSGLEVGTTLRGNANVVRNVTFDTRGFSGSTGTLRFCDPRGAAEARGIIISNTGRARQALDSNGDGTVEGGGGANLTCP